MVEVCPVLQKQSRYEGMSASWGSDKVRVRILQHARETGIRLQVKNDMYIAFISGASVILDIVQSN